jgi:hypothetical protein
MSYTEEQFKEDVEVTKKILKDTYVSNIIYVQERVKEKADESELKQIDELILATERLIIYFDENDDWVKNLHEEAKNGGTSDGGNDGISDGVFTEDDEGAAARIEEARNS